MCECPRARQVDSRKAKPRDGEPRERANHGSFALEIVKRGDATRFLPVAGEPKPFSFAVFGRERWYLQWWGLPFDVRIPTELAGS